MKEILFEIDKESKFFLKELIGKKSQLIYSDRFIKQYGESSVEASYFVFGNAGIKISSRWFECSETLDDYYSIVVTKEEFAIEHNSSIFSFVDQSVLRSISILCRSIKDDDLIIIHDFGVLIEREDKKKVCIIGGESAFQNVVLIEDEDQIKNLIKKERATINPLKK